MLGELVKSGYYASIAKQPVISPSEGEAYVYVRAHIVLGQYDRAEILLRDYHAKGTLKDSFLHRFLTLQLKCFRTISPDDQLVNAMTSLECLVPNDFYLQGEYHLISGFLHSRRSDYRSALLHDEMAAESYRASGEYPACLAVALFNQCVSLNHLNFRDGFKLKLSELRRLAQQYQLPTVQLAYLRLQGVLLLGEEDFAAALACFKEAMEVCICEGRWRDLGGIACSAFYSAVRLGQSFRDLEQILEITSSFKQHLLNNHLSILNHMRSLTERHYINRKELAACMANWKAEGIEGANFLLLSGVALTQLERCENFADLKLYAKRLARDSISMQVAMSLLDTRYFEAVADMNLGETYLAETQLSGYLADGLARQAEAKIRRAQELYQRLQIVWNQSEPVNPESGKMRLKPLVYYLKEHSLEFDGRIFNLVNLPKLDAFFKVLVQRKNVSLSAMFFELYGATFNPSTHERRLHSLIERSRTLLQDRQAIVRSDGMLSLAPYVISRVVSGTYNRESISSRRYRILQFIQSEKTSVLAAKVAQHFPGISKRTLQADLLYLTKANLIKSSGITRNRQYTGITS